MTVFELGRYFAPIAGLVAGVTVAKGQPIGIMIVWALGGLLIGAGAFLGPVLASAFVWSHVRRPDAPLDRPGSIEWLAGTTIVLLAALSPVIAWESVMFVASRLFGPAS